MYETEYDRPREKLRSRGASALSTAELLQVIIGSGTRGYSSATIAREIAVVIRSPIDTLGPLEAIPGVGSVKASQVLAALELGRRLNYE